MESIGNPNPPLNPRHKTLTPKSKTLNPKPYTLQNKSRSKGPDYQGFNDLVVATTSHLLGCVGLGFRV